MRVVVLTGPFNQDRDLSKLIEITQMIYFPENVKLNMKNDLMGNWYVGDLNCLS